MEAPRGSVNLKKLPFITNKVYYPLYKDKHRYMVLYGGAGSGKSVFVAQKLIFRMLTEKGHKILVVRKVANTLRNSTFSLLKSTISDWGFGGAFKINKGDMEITCLLNGNTIIHAGLDDVEKLKSIHGLTGIWIEEASEITQEDFQQLDLRLRGVTPNYKQIILSFNPISITHWLKKVFFDNPIPDSIALKTTYIDNAFLDDSYEKVLLQLKDQDEYYFSVYALGMWGVVGTSVFNGQVVTERLIWLQSNEHYVKRGNLTYKYENEQIAEGSVQFVDDERGNLTIYEEPQRGHPYVIGVDTSEGGYDFSVAQVIDNSTGRQVATWRGHTDTDLLAKQMYCLGKYYGTQNACNGDALIGVESNFDTHPIKELDRLGYSMQYYRETLDTITNKMVRKFGFVTSKITRPIIIANLVKIVREDISLLSDQTTLEEMLTFTRDEMGKPQAEEGSHDDTVMALAITYQIRDQQSYEVHREGKMLKGWYTEDELQDMGYSKYEIKRIMEGMKAWN